MAKPPSRGIGSETATVTAGFSNADWTADGLPDGTRVVPANVGTIDGALCKAFLYAAGSPDTVVCIMHPREFSATHYLIPHILRAGCAAWAQAPRQIGNDIRLEHETALLDVAAGLAYLKAQGFRRIVLLGNSGGASLYTFYNEQSLLDPARRIGRTPAGRATRLAEAVMPVVDGLAYVAPHPGQGLLLQACIDPSVSDERDAMSVDASLDPFDPANGFVEPSASSHYQPDFVARYRAAQEARVARLDRLAHDLVAERRAARKRLEAGSGSLADRRAAFHTAVIEVWRTDADLRCFDLGLDPSDRKYGSVWGRDPYASNYGCIGFGRICTADSWLSTWSGLSSNAAMPRTLTSVEQPALMIEYTGDNTIFPADVAGMYAALRTSSKSLHRVRGDHHGRALARGEAPGRVESGRLVEAWLRDQFSA